MPVLVFGDHASEVAIGVVDSSRALGDVMSGPHSCIVCVYKRMLRYPIPDTVRRGSDHLPVCERHEPDLKPVCPPGATMVRGYELYPQGSDS